MTSGEQIVWRRPGLRDRYRIENRLCRGLVVTAPWISAVLLVVGYLLLTSPFVLQPGVIIQLPEAPFTSGSPYGHRLAILSLETPAPGVREEIVFFEDERFLMKDPSQQARLGKALTAACRERPEASLIVEADARVQHGTLVRIFTMATEAGIKSLNLATRPSR
jgi:biopolymer transport protein ExbD